MSATMYAFKCDAQQWRDDPYYVASSEPTYRVTVVAETKAAAVAEVLRVLGPAALSRSWRVWVRDVTDVRLLAAPATEAESEA